MEDKHNWKRSPYIILLATLFALMAFCEIAPLFSASLVPLHSKLSRLAIENVNYAVAGMSGTLMYFFLLPRRKGEMWFVLAGGAICDACIIAERLNYIGVYGQILHLGLGYYPFALAAMVWRFLQYLRQGDSEEMVHVAEVFACCLAMPVFYASGETLVVKDSKVYDAMLMAADSMFGTQISFWTTRYLNATLAGRLFGYIAYFYLAFFMLMAQMVVYKRSRPEESHLPQPTVVPAWLYIVTALLGVWCYQIYPAVGTENFCGTGIFPNGPIPEINFIPQAKDAPLFLPRNAMPSLHLTWILCAFFSVCRLKKSYCQIWGWAAFCVWLSAFSIGKHWLSDFIVALPFTTMCMGITCTGASWARRLTATIIGGLCCFGLMLLYKYHILWVMDHRFLYLALVAAIDIGSWQLSLSLLPPKEKPQPATDENQP